MMNRVDDDAKCSFRGNGELAQVCSIGKFTGFESRESSPARLAADVFFAVRKVSVVDGDLVFNEGSVESSVSNPPLSLQFCLIRSLDFLPPFLEGLEVFFRVLETYNFMPDSLSGEKRLERISFVYETATVFTKSGGVFLGKPWLVFIRFTTSDVKRSSVSCRQCLPEASSIRSWLAAINGVRKYLRALSTKTEKIKPYSCTSPSTASATRFWNREICF